MLYQLPDGRTIEISVNDYLDYSDEELRQLAGSNYGDVLNNPSYGSAIKGKQTIEPDDGIYAGKDISEVPNQEKLNDQDYITEE